MKILVAIDNSRCSNFVLQDIAKQNWAKNVQFEIVMVVEPAVYDYGYAFSTRLATSLAEANREYRRYCGKFVKAKVDQIRKVTGITKVAGKILDGSVADAIIDEAKTWKADLIMLGSHGRKGIQKLFLGSVAERVATHSPCSVQITKRKARAK